MKAITKTKDGRLYFHDESGPGAKTKQIILSVKGGGNLKPEFVRELRGVTEREGAQLGVLITLEKPTREMRTEAAAGGFYASPMGAKPQRIQMLTVEEILNGKGIDYPGRRLNVTFKKAPRVKKEIAEKGSLSFD